MTFWESALIGLFGGGGLALIQITLSAIKKHCDRQSIYKWLMENTENQEGERFRTVKAIAAHNNQTPDRVRFLCSSHKKIYPSTGTREDLWRVHGGSIPEFKSLLDSLLDETTS
jgi:hypothetical protein